MPIPKESSNTMNASKILHAAAHTFPLIRSTALVPFIPSFSALVRYDPTQIQRLYNLHNKSLSLTTKQPNVTISPINYKGENKPQRIAELETGRLLLEEDKVYKKIKVHEKN